LPGGSHAIRRAQIEARVLRALAVSIALLILTVSLFVNSEISVADPTKPSLWSAKGRQLLTSTVGPVLGPFLLLMLVATLFVLALSFSGLIMGISGE
jgi:ACR3 family arsenite efflux pump ArsB